MTFLFIWLLFGIAAAIAATNKGRDGCGWFILGVLLGPFGLLFALLVSSNDPQMEASSKPSENAEPGKRCPDCAEIVKAQARVCRFCGYRFPSEQFEGVVGSGGDDPDKKTTSKGSKNVKRCPGCGTRSWDWAERCPQCGDDMREVSATEREH